MQEFKLIDLNEGKILELGKDFLYGGEFISPIKKPKPGQMSVSVAGWIRNSLINFKDAIDFSKDERGIEDDFDEAYDELFDDLYKNLGKNADLQFEELENPIKLNKTPFSQSTHTKLIPILEKTGAELFGDRYVLFKDRAISFDKKLMMFGLRDWFLEYSLLLKGEPNRFDEFCELVK